LWAIPDDTKRSFNIDGTITVTQASDGEVKFIPSKPTLAECNALPVADLTKISPFKLDAKGTFNVE
jgi:hypothetical protein